jgi:CMP-N-acetylneuraminic acid synthetase
MKIIAVIPARGGSKGIPNKNIRLVNGKPLIYYTIENAIKSKYITDIIVTTDSVEIQLIARQMGVKCKEREKYLCGDKVTLDEVIFDVVKDVECDIAVTMQPTSPTLKVQTLDRAIEYFLVNKLDTLISAINSPRLSWRKADNGRMIPNYEKRVNRQYLPKEFAETGAFVISDRMIMNKNTRIGMKTDIFEISEEEAIDIDDFSDLLYAEYVLGKKKIAMYVNGNNKRGMGHIYRSLDIADEFYAKPDIFYDVNQTERKLFGDTKHNLIPIKNIEELYDYVEREQYSIFINDVLSTSVEYMKKLRSACRSMKIVNFEDDSEGGYRADLLINALYQEAEFNKMKAGYQYYVVPKVFLFYPPIKINNDVNRVFISFGGADPRNYTQRLIDIVTKKKYDHIDFVVAVGRAYKNVADAMQYNSYPNISVYYDVGNMPELMYSCDIAVTSRGRTGYELALLGIPTISMAQNAREEKHGFISAEHGFNYLGMNPSDSYIELNLDMFINMSKADREMLQEKMLSCDLKSGRKRVISLINNL